MKKISIIIIIFIIFIMVILMYAGSKTGQLASPGFSTGQQLTVFPSTTPPPIPKTFQFDSLTDLEAELEKVDPKVLDSDFE